MSGKAFVTICSLLFFQLASTRVLVRDVPATVESSDLLDDLLSESSDMLKEVQGTVFEAVCVNKEQFNSFVASEIKIYAAKLENLSREMKKHIKESDDVKQLRSRVDEAILTLKKEHPVVANIVANITMKTKSVIDKVSNIWKSESANQIKDIGILTLKITTDALKEFIKKVTEESKST